MPEPAPLQRPSWLPSYLPEFDGLRGLAMLAVVIFHCHTLLVGTWLHGFAIWGWSGVTMFFFLSGFLITGNLLAVRFKPRYFHNFHAKRALRIWPLYILLLVLAYVGTSFYNGPFRWQAAQPAPWLLCLVFLQNLFHVSLSPAIGPTWALACEEQFYFFWTPAVRWLKQPWMLGVLLLGALTLSPTLRHMNLHWLTPTHTLIHLDGLALGCLLALGFYTLGWAQRTWQAIGVVAFVGGILAAATVAGGTGYLDSALAVGYGGAALALAASTGSQTPIHWLFSRGPLAYLGKVSYSLYLSHICVFICLGWFDDQLKPYGMPGNVTIVCYRVLFSTLVASALWYWVEKPILQYKRHFQSAAK